MELYDKNGDGKLDQQEMRACAALLDAGPRVDRNRDQTVTAEELAGRLVEIGGQSAFLAATTFVNWNGKPLAGAEVILEPEPFMGEGFPAFRGQTDPTGSVLLASETDGSNLLPLGFYRARISKTEGGAEKIPSQYNTQTTLGLEVADDAASPNRIRFDLKSN